MSFVPQTFLDRITSGVDPVLADAQDFGIVQLTDDGIVRMYNRWESTLAGVAAASTLGRNFFTQVAPCTNNRLVFGKFKDGVQVGALDTEFSYTFTYKMKPTNVVLRLYRHRPTATNWMFVGLR